MLAAGAANTQRLCVCFLPASFFFFFLFLEFVFTNKTSGGLGNVMGIVFLKLCSAAQFPPSAHAHTQKKAGTGGGSLILLLQKQGLVVGGF